MLKIDERLEQFKYNVEAASGSVQFVLNNSNDISEALKEQTNPNENVLVSVNNREIINPFLETINPIFSPSKEEIISTPICITDSVCGIAKTGSLIVISDANYGTYFTMLTQVHIVLLNAYDIYDKPSDLFERPILNLTNQESFSIISGPSATADMGSLVRGVHGPQKLHIIVIN